MNGHDEAWRLTASALSDAYKTGSLTPSAALASVLDRLEAVNPIVNAVVTLDVEGARQAARASDERWRNGSPASPIDGVPLTVKDNIHVAGLRTTWGSRLFEREVPLLDETPVARLRAAGAIILGKTNVPELTLQGYTSNAIFGVTRNPWSPAMTPGGSSGGAVAAVASGIGPLALATDGGGSIRRPAAHTGLVGLKPSRGMVPRRNGLPAILNDFEVAGPIARTVEDVVLMMDVIGGPRWSATAGQQPTARRLRVLYVPTFGNAPVDPLIAQAIGRTARAISEAGHDVEETSEFTFAAPIDDVWPVVSEAGVAWLLDTHPDGREAAEALVGDAIHAMAIRGRAYSAARYLSALDTARTVAQRFDDLFDTHDLLMTPTTAAMPWPAETVFPPTIDGQAVGPRGHAVFTAFANATGLPTISLPCAVEAGQMPIGFQLVGRSGSDRTLLDAARRIARVIGNHGRWPETR